MNEKKKIEIPWDVGIWDVVRMFKEAGYTWEETKEELEKDYQKFLSIHGKDINE
ncbi:hypothetical protein [Bacillus salacetis]|uniref:hypothetical protein n=1 Tax=Bacillus salacetis TaxID=2315464 RepID=UPI00144393E5|nr:hypothetical protein [Bacillus salacetis]